MLQRLCDAALDRQDTACLPQLLKSAHEAHRLLEQVRRARLLHEEASGKLVSREASNRNLTVAATMVKEYLLSLADTCGLRCNPENPSLAASVLEEWAHHVLISISESMCSDSLEGSESIPPG